MADYILKKIPVEKQEEILGLFYKLNDNRDATIASIIGVNTKLVSEFISHHCDEKMKRINKKVNERYEKANEKKRFQVQKDVRLSVLVKNDSEQSETNDNRCLSAHS